MSDLPPKPKRRPSWSKSLINILLVCGGCVATLLPAWLPNRPAVPLESGTVELLQAFLLAASAAIVWGASSHAGAYRPVCRVLGLGFLAAFVGEIEDFASNILDLKFPEAGVVAVILGVILIDCLRHRRIVFHFFATIGNHAGAGFIAAALLILYVFNRIIGSPKFWLATLGEENFSALIPRTCLGYLELLACYLIFVGALGLSLTLARRSEPHS